MVRQCIGLLAKSDINSSSGSPSPSHYFEDANYLLMLGNAAFGNELYTTTEQNLYVEFRGRTGKHLELNYYNSSNTKLGTDTLEANANNQYVTTLLIPSGTYKITAASNFDNPSMANCALLIAY